MSTQEKFSDDHNEKMKLCNWYPVLSSIASVGIKSYLQS